jgi:hypothetical protein
VLAGFSVGTGEVTRYLGMYGSDGVSKAALLGVIPPFRLQTTTSRERPRGFFGQSLVPARPERGRKRPTGRFDRYSARLGG